MGDTIVVVREARDIDWDEEYCEHPVLARYIYSLDAATEAAGTRPLSKYVDAGAVLEMLEDELPADLVMNAAEWFEAAEAIAAVEAVAAYLRENGPPPIPEAEDGYFAVEISPVEPDDVEQLLEDLDDCLMKLKNIGKNGGKFHLALIP